MTNAGMDISRLVAPMPYEPRQLPDARIAMMRLWRDGGIAHLSWRAQNVGSAWLDSNDELIAKTHREALSQSTLYWFSEEMTETIVGACDSVPPDVTLTPDILPSVRGIAFFQGEAAIPITVNEEVDRRLVEELDMVDAYQGAPEEPRVNVLQWYPFFITSEERFALRIDFYVTVQSLPFPMAYIGGSTWHFGTRLDAVPRSAADYVADVEDSLGCLEDRKRMVAVASMISSPGVVDESKTLIDKPARKRSKRAGVENLDAVRVINLRGSRGSSSSDGDGGSYHHRWVVRGHWRSQPYGPGRKFRKAVWIAPHIKGPEGAPLLNGEKVYKVSA